MGKPTTSKVTEGFMSDLPNAQHAKLIVLHQLYFGLNANLDRRTDHTPPSSTRLTL